MDVAPLPGVPRASHVLALLGAACTVFAVAPGCAGDGDAHSASATLSAEATSVCPTGFLGDRRAPPILELRALRSDGVDVPLYDGADLAIVTPSQGGRVGFVGVRATNLDGCGVQIFAVLRDPVSNETRLDGRTVNLLRDGDGFGTSGAVTTDLADHRELGSYAHIPLCPNQWAAQDVFDAPFELEVRAVDRGGRTATRVARVTPRCSEGGARSSACRCLCRKDYVQGSCSAPAAAP